MLNRAGAGQSNALYLVDFIREELLKDYSEQELMPGGFSVYTALVPERATSKSERSATSDLIWVGCREIRSEGK
jgi:membrane carboxypeptidase/penicillin-binding protein